MLEANRLEGVFSEKALEVLVDTNLTKSQQCPLVAKKANGILDCTRSCRCVRPHLECWDQFWAPQHKRVMEILNRA